MNFGNPASADFAFASQSLKSAGSGARRQRFEMRKTFHYFMLLTKQCHGEPIELGSKD